MLLKVIPRFVILGHDGLCFLGLFCVAGLFLWLCCFISLVTVLVVLKCFKCR